MAELNESRLAARTGAGLRRDTLFQAVSTAVIVVILAGSAAALRGRGAETGVPARHKDDFIEILSRKRTRA